MFFSHDGIIHRPFQQKVLSKCVYLFADIKDLATGFGFFLVGFFFFLRGGGGGGGVAFFGFVLFFFCCCIITFVPQS